MIRALASASTSIAPAEQNDLPHVLLVVDQFPKALGGGERIALRLASLLPKYHFRPSILTFLMHPESPALLSPPCPIYELPLRRTYDFTAVRGALALRRFLKHQRVSIVQTFFESSDLWAGLVTKTVPGVKLIWSRRDMGILRRRKHGVGYRLLSDLPDAVFAVSEEVRRYCIEVDAIDHTRVHTIYNGLDLAEWDVPTRPDKPEGKLSVVTVGNIRRIKGHDVLIRAAASIAAQFPNVSFSIAGEVLETDYFTELQALISQLKLSDHFHFLGPVKGLRQLFATADIFVLPSRSEGFSNAIVEAMAAALPVIATDVGGNGEAILDGVTGCLIPPDSPESLYSALAKFISNPSRARAMGLAARSRVAERFTTEAMMDQSVKIYEKLLARR